MPSWSDNWADGGKGGGKGRAGTNSAPFGGGGGSGGGRGRGDYYQQQQRRDGGGYGDGGYYGNATPGPYPRADRDWQDETPPKTSNHRSADGPSVGGGTNGRISRAATVAVTAAAAAAASAAPPQEATQEELAGLEAQVMAMERQHKEALEKINEKQSEKFDLIFGILSELQGRQGRLEESIKTFMSSAGCIGVAVGPANGPSSANVCGAVPVGGCAGSFGGCGAMQARSDYNSFGSPGGCGGCGGCGGGCNGGMWAMGGNFQYQAMQQFADGCFSGGHMGFGSNGCSGGCNGAGLGGAMAPQQQQQQQQQQMFVAPVSQLQGQQFQPEQQQLLHSNGADTSTDAGGSSAEAQAASGSMPWQPRRPLAPHSQNESSSPAPTGPQDAAASAASAPGGGGGSGGGGGESWGKLRIWKVVGLSEEDPKTLPVVSRAEPFTPSYGRTPTDDLVVVWLKNGDTVKQMGHSKKVRGHMVMPVKILRAEGCAEGGDGEEEGWVTRRQLGSGSATWFEDVTGGGGEADEE